ncbi:MAG TPA: GNAT family N-acetyltransferase [Vicinamibacterales bacterium]|nr:GNAT family N-acetyltransferase [Vicinamibacterales bacterium]
MREVRESDIETFYLQQADPESAAMAAFQSRDREAAFARWREIMANESGVSRTIVVVGSGGREAVAGHIVSWEHDGVQEVGYWVGREFWGRGVATEAVRQFLAVISTRPLFAWAAAHNAGSQRVLEKNGFTYQRDDEGFRVYRLD